MTDVPKSFILPKGERPRALQNALLALGSLDKKRAWRVTIAPVRSERSLVQNAYLHVCYKLLSDGTGYESEELHEYLLGRYFGWRDKKVPKKPSNQNGIESVPIRTTTKDESGKRSVLSKTEFAGYVEFIQRFAAVQLQIVLPDPDPNYLINRERQGKAA